MANTWPSRYAVDPKAKMKTPNALALKLHRNAEAIANNVYADRLGNGNEASGDGWKCRGKGAIQLTGRDNQTAFANYVGIPFDAIGGYLLTIEGAIEGACWFWLTKRLNRFCDAGDYEGLTKAINGALNGFADRKLLLAEAEKVVIV